MAANYSRGFSLKAFERSIADKKPAPIYFFYGSQEFRIKRAVAAIKKRVLKEANPETGWCVYDLAETDFSQLLADVRTVSFFGGLRGVMATNFTIKKERSDESGRSEQGKKLLDEEDQKRLLEYLKNPSPDVVLLLVTEKADMRKKFWKTLAAQAETIVFETKDQKRLVAEIMQESPLSFDAEARRWVVENYEHSCSQLESEFQKLETYLGGKKNVSLADVEECMNAPRSDSVFNLTTAIASGNVDESLRLLKMLKAQGDFLQVVTALIARQFRILLVLKSLAGKNLTQAEIARRCSVHPYYFEEYVKQAVAFSLPKLKQILLALSAADIQMKRASLDGWMILENSIISFIAEREPRAV